MEVSQSNHVSERFTYDDLGRLRTTRGSWNQALTYDDLGNITTNSRLGTYSYPPVRACVTLGRCAGPHAVTAAGPTSYRYDAAGDLTATFVHGVRAKSLRWSADGLPTRIGSASAGYTATLYSPEGEAIQRSVGGATTSYFGALADWSARRGFTTYVYAGSTLIARHAAGRRVWYTTDVRGTPRVLTDRQARVVGRVDTAPLARCSTDRAA